MISLEDFVVTDTGSLKKYVDSSIKRLVNLVDGVEVG